MRLPPLTAGKFITRPNRFACWVDLNGEQVYCHMPNPGRMWELLFEGTELWVTPRKTEGVTTHSVVLARAPESLVCLNSNLPPSLFDEARSMGLIPELEHCTERKAEVKLGASRIDLQFKSEDETWWVETKSCTLVVDHQARFPDAPTIRGTKHLRELIEIRQQGMQAAVAFMIQRSDAESFAPQWETDPVFASTFYEAIEAGVSAFAVLCEVTPQEVRPVRRMEIEEFKLH